MTGHLGSPCPIGTGCPWSFSCRYRYLWAVGTASLARTPHRQGSGHGGSRGRRKRGTGRDGGGVAIEEGRFGGGGGKGRTLGGFSPSS